MAELTQALLRETLNYNPDTGSFTWLKPGKPHLIGSSAGCFDKEGYVVIAVFKRQYRAHRLAWLYVHGQWPAGDVDHKDNVRSNNAIDNLRIATNSQNQGNARRPRTNTSGFKGVCFHRRSRKWQAGIRRDGRVVYLGSFDTPEAAHDAYVRAAHAKFGEFARTA